MPEKVNIFPFKIYISNTSYKINFGCTPSSPHCLSNIRDCILSVQKIEKKVAQQHSFHQNICHYVLFTPVYKNKLFYLIIFSQEPSPQHLQVILEINFPPIEDSNKLQMPVRLSLFFFEVINMK